MEPDKVNLYSGKRVLIILKNNWKFTTVIPKFEGTSFEIIDKKGVKALIDCDMISMIYEKEDENE